MVRLHPQIITQIQMSPTFLRYHAHNESKRHILITIQGGKGVCVLTPVSSPPKATTNLTPDALNPLRQQPK